MDRSLPRWVRMPGGVYHVRWLPLLRAFACSLCAAASLLAAYRLTFVRQPHAMAAPLSEPSVARLPFSNPEPLTRLFALDTEPPVRFVLLSTLLGPRPTATLGLEGHTYTVVRGDTVAGAVVDSIGRRTVILVRGNEVIRAEM